MGGWTQQDVDARRSRLGLPPAPPVTGITKQPKAQKYNARKKEVDGITFDSSREAKRYVELKALQVIGMIRNLELQPRYLLQEGFRELSGKWVHQIEYVPDFRYEEWGGRIVRDEFPHESWEWRLVVEDVKGMRLPIYLLKLKLFKAKYPQIDFREVR